MTNNNVENEKSVQSFSFQGSLTAQKEAGECWLTSGFINQLWSESTKEKFNFQAHGEKKGKMRTKKLNQSSRKKTAKKKHEK